jgi:Inner membrane component of T3SS, cytoplasmic domain
VAPSSKGQVVPRSVSGYWLEWEQGGIRSRLPLDRPLRIGRDPGCDVVLADPTVSRRHAVVSVSSGQPLVDAGSSTNGIQLDRGRADRVALGPTQAFSIGGTTFRVVQTSAAQLPLAAPTLGSSVSATPRRTPARTRGSNAPAVAIAILAVVVVAAVIAAIVLHPFGESAAQRPSAAASTAPPWSVSAGAMPSDAPAGLAGALQSFAPPKPVFGPGFVVEKVRAEGDWAVAFGHAVAGPSDSNTPTETIVVIAHRIAPAWRTTSSRDQGFCAQLVQLPEGIMNATERSLYGCD